MAKFQFFLIALLFVLKLDHSLAELKIINGRDATRGQFPFYINLKFRDEYEHHCGGTLITRWDVLTAAHCIRGFEVTELVAVAGTVNCNKVEDDRQAIPIKSAEVHDDTDQMNDIAIARTVRPFKINKVVKVLPFTGAEAPLGATVTVIGCGLISKDEYPNILQWATAKIHDLDQCKNRRQESPGDGLYCIGGGGGKAPMLRSGDSGSGAVYHNQVIGLVSRGHLHGGKGAYYVKLSYYTNWILERIKESPGRRKPSGPKALFRSIGTPSSRIVNYFFPFLLLPFKFNV